MRITIPIIYGTDTGDTEETAHTIANTITWTDTQPIDIADLTPDQYASYTHLILGTPTWDFGQNQPDWHQFLNQPQHNLTHQTIALYGLGDQHGYPNHYLNALGHLHKIMTGLGASIVGQWPAEGYGHETSTALNKAGTHFVGLALDQDSEPHLTTARIERWVEMIAPHFGGPLEE